MENTKNGKSSGDVYSSLTRGSKDWDSSIHSDVFAEIPRLKYSRRSETVYRTCEAAAFLFLACALLYCYASLWDLKYEVENLKGLIKFKMPSEEKDPNMLMEDDASSIFGHLIMLDANEAGENPVNPLKQKREITLWHEQTSESSERSKYESTSSRSIDSDEYSSESIQNVETSSPRSRKRRKDLRKPKKYHRRPISAEKFFTDIESTTASSIQIRQSRTKHTAGFDFGKHKRVLEHRPLLQVYGSKEFITKEEALRRPGGLRNIKSEKESGKRPNPGNGSQIALSTSGELGESLSYNMIMVHYAADTSHYSRERDSHYCGNGRMKMKENMYRDWKAAHSTQGADISRYFSLHRGEVTVSVTGIYLIYAQVQYSNLEEVNGYEVIRNKQSVVQCITTSVHPDKQEIKSNTCGTSTTILLYAGDGIYIQDLHHGRHVVLKPEKSYFGLILLSPFKDKRLL